MAVPLRFIVVLQLQNLDYWWCWGRCVSIDCTLQAMLPVVVWRSIPEQPSSVVHCA